MKNELNDQMKRLLEAKDRLYEKSVEVQEKRDVFKKKRSLLQKQKEDFIISKEYNLKIIAENKSRYGRAIRKAADEIPQTKEYKIELKQCLVKSEQLLKDLVILVHKTNRMTVYDTCIKDAIAILPQDYFAGIMDPERLIFRYEGLNNISHILSLSFTTNIHQMNTLVKVIYDLQANEEKALLFRNKDLNDLYIMEGKVHEKMKKIDIHMFNEIAKLRSKIHIFGVTIRALGNITEKCISRKDALFLRKPLKETITLMTINNKISAIKNFIMNSRNILEYLDTEKSVKSI